MGLSIASDRAGLSPFTTPNPGVRHVSHPGSVLSKSVRRQAGAAAREFAGRG
jgi:hypothetical protein